LLNTSSTKVPNPNAQDHLGQTPLMYTMPYAPGAANFAGLPRTPILPVNLESPLERFGRSKYVLNKLDRPDN
jgi:hypothetical protein